MDYSQNTIRYKRRIQQLRDSLMPELDLRIDDESPAIARVINCSCDAVIEDVQLTEGKLLMEGKYFFSCLYEGQADEESGSALFSCTGEKAFTHYINTPEAHSGMQCTAKSKVIHCQALPAEAGLQGSRGVKLDVVVELDCNVWEAASKEIVTGHARDASMQSRAKTLYYDEPCGRLQGQAFIKENLALTDDLPAIERIVSCSTSYRTEAPQTGEGSITLPGELLLDILYLSTEGELCSFAGAVPFSKEIEFADTIESLAYDGGYRRGESYIAAREDALGNKTILDTEFLVKYTVDLFDKKSVQTITDVFTTDGSVSATNSNIETEHLVDRVMSTKELEYEDTVEVHSGTIVYAKANAYTDEAYCSLGSIHAEGVIDIGFLVVESDGTSAMIEKQLPFALSMPAENAREEHSVTIEFETQLDQVRLHNGKLSFTAIVKAEALVYEMIASTVVAELASGEPAEQKPGFYVYFIQPEDDLFTIAKKYTVDPKVLSSLNGLNADPDKLERSDGSPLGAGDPLFIHKRVQ